jgi:hypothetical protein
MAVGPRLAVEAPQLTPGRRGLIASAVEVTEPSDRWVNGFAFDPEVCEEALALPIFCDPFGDATKDAGDNPAIVEYDPFALLGWDECSTLDRRRDREGRARRHLLANESDGIERELWDGAIARAEGLPNAFLASSAATDLGSAGAITALAALEQALADCLHGQRGMIHATVTTTTVWNALGLLRVDSGLLLTAMDTIVVPGSGYSGSTPAPGGTGADPDDPTPPADIKAAAFAYATGMVYLRRGPIAPVGDQRSQIDRSVNLQTVFVERPVAAVWNGCCHFGIEVDHAEAGVAF